MSRRARVWWWKPKGYWVTDLGGRRIYLAKGWRNRKSAEQEFKRLAKEQELLSATNGAISIAALSEMFLDDAAENLAPKTYESYRYACQFLVDLDFGQVVPNHVLGRALGDQEMKEQ